MTSDGRGVVESSRTYQSVRWLEERLDGLARPLRVGFGESRTASGFGTAGRWTRASWLYRWLTAEPDSREIVIDLRRSYAVGWLVELGEGGLGPLERAASRATSNRFLQHAAAHPVPIAGAALLGAVFASIVRAWPVADPIVLAAYALALCVSGLGLVVPDSATALANSRTVALFARAVDPPEPPP